VVKYQYGQLVLTLRGLVLQIAAFTTHQLDSSSEGLCCSCSYGHEYINSREPPVTVGLQIR